jgi:ketosteroid isomerase-like protein
MRFQTALAVSVLTVLLAAAPASAQDVDTQTRHEIEAAHMRWVDALNGGDLDAFATLYTPSTIGVDAFGRQLGVNPEVLQTLHKKGITLTMPIEGVQALKGGPVVIAYGTFSSKYADPNVSPGQGNWVQVFERDGDIWKVRIVASSRSALAAQAK